jgi:gliding motility-associated-like protein
MRFIAVFLFVFSLSGLLPAQTSNISEGCFPIAVSFTAPAGQTGFFWDFKDGNTSTLENPTNLFIEAGQYVVEFKNTPGGAIVGTVTVDIYAKPELMVSVDPAAGCPGLEVVFTDETVYDPALGLESRQWTFGNGTGGAGLMDSTIYNLPGSYDVSLNATFSIPSCNTTVIFDDLVDILPPPVAEFTTDPNPPFSCDEDLEVTFTNASTGTGVLSYEWNMGNGNTYADLNPPLQNYPASGSYWVVLTVSDANGCETTDSLAVTTGPGALNISLPDTICKDVQFQVINSAPSGTNLWVVGPEAEISNVNLRRPFIKFTEAGLFSIQYLWNGFGGTCLVDTTFTILVLENTFEYEMVVEPEDYCGPPVELTFIPTPDQGTFEWNFEDWGQFTDSIPSFAIEADPNPFSIYGMRLIPFSVNYTTPWGCKGDYSFIDTLHVAVAAFMPLEYKACFPNDITFLDLSYSREIVRWTWHFGDGNTMTYNDYMEEVTHTYENCDIYEVFLVIEDASGCIDTSYTLEVKICGCEQDPNDGVCTGVGLDQLIELCHGDTFNYGIQAGVDVASFRVESDGYRLWHCSPNEPGLHEFSWVFEHEPGFHTVGIFWETFQGDRDSVFYNDIILVKGAWARMNYKIDCEDPFAVMFWDSSMNATNLLWEFPDGTTYTTDSFTHTFAETGDYLVYLTAWNEIDNCPPDRDSVWIYIRDIQADFNIPEQICQGAPLALDATQSQDVNAFCHKGYAWTFSAGPRPQILGEPEHEVQLNEPCENIVTLTVTDINGCTHSLSKSINVQAITASIDLEVERICLPATIQPEAVINPLCGSLENIEWVAGLSVMAQGPNPTISIPEGTLVVNGSVTLVLTATTELGCPGTASIQIPVYEPESSILTEPQPPVCVGEQINFDAVDFTSEGSFLTWDWNFGNGQTSTTKTNPVTYNQAGIYTVVLNFTEDKSGCKGQTSRQIEVQGIPEASFSSNFDLTKPICYPGQIQFTNTTMSGSPITNLVWNPGNSDPIQINQEEVVYSYGKGTYTMSLYVETSAGCADSVSSTFTLIGPEGSVETNVDEICVGESVTFTLTDTVDVGSWTWFFQGETFDNENPITHTFSKNSSNDLSARILLWDPTNTCSFEFDIPLSIFETVADFAIGDGPFCPGSMINIANSSQDANTFAWTFSGGVPPSSSSSPTVTLPSTEGPFTISLTASIAELGCIDQTEQTIQITNLELTQLFGDIICPGETAIIGVGDMLDSTYTFSWSPSANVVNPDSAVTSVTGITQNTTFAVTVDNGMGCSAVGTVEVIVLQPMTFNDWDTTVVLNSTFVLPGPIGSNFNYQWSPSSGLSCTDCANPTFTALTVGTTEYVLFLTDVAGCYTYEIVYIVKVLPDNFDVPNVFSPNGDDVNDFFQVVVKDGELEDVKIIRLQVFSRWGQLVYDNEKPDQGWDGTYKDKPSPADVYAYVVEVEFFDGRKVLRRGDITLVR